MNVTQKILASHLVSGTMTVGNEISISIDQTLTQDSTGTMAYLQFQAIGVDQVKTKKSVAYIDHNTLQAGFENADDHRYIETVAKKHGVFCSKAGNGICHQVHLERFGIPGQTLLGSDSHTPTGGGLGMLAIGAGGLDVAVAMAGGEFFLTMPKVVGIKLTGKLLNFVSAKDIILKVLQHFTVKGGVAKVFEYFGSGVSTLSVPQRATITNMGAELGATSSVFPSDANTLDFLMAQNRAIDYTPLVADSESDFDEVFEIDLSTLVPLVAKPHSPDNVDTVANISGMKIDQVAIGSCTNSSFTDMMTVAQMLKGKTVCTDVSLVISAGSKQVLTMLAKNGALADILSSGARVLESACGPCIGMGQAPKSNAISLRTFNRNFEGRSGTASAQVYLVSPETAVASALAGVVVDPTTLSKNFEISLPSFFDTNDNLVVPPVDPKNQSSVIVEQGPNIKPFPIGKKIVGSLKGKVLIKLDDNITTDHIMPSTASLLPFRSNIPYLAEFCLSGIDKDFASRAKKENGGFIVAKSNYGQGSSREHAALAPLQLGVKGVIAISYARIHKANLINNGILPMEFVSAHDFEKVLANDEISIEDAAKQLKNATKTSQIMLTLGQSTLPVKLEITSRQCDILLSGGLLNFSKESGK